MIVRDNESTIGPCLASIRPYVDEIVVVDTGSKDNTPDICRQYGARMFEFPWCDDFSAARNESLKHARGEWIFWMDSDDTISPECGKELRELANKPHPDNIHGYIMQVHCPGSGEDGDLDVTAVDHVKLFRNRPDLRFEGRIHEQLMPAIRRANGDVAWTDIHVRHSGSDHSPVAWQRKLDRDLRILHLELAESPNHPFVLFNLGMTYADAATHSGAAQHEQAFSREAQPSAMFPAVSDPPSRPSNYTEAIGYLQRCLAVSTPDQTHLRKAFAILVNALEQSHRPDEAWTTCQNGLALYPDDKELLFRSAMLHHHFGRLPEAAETYRRVLNDREERHFTSIHQGISSFLTRHNLAAVYEQMGLLDQAETEWRRIVADVPAYHLGWRGLGEALIRQRKFLEAERLCEQLSCSPAFSREAQPSAMFPAAAISKLAVESRILRAKLALARGDLGTAVRELQAARAADREDAEPLRILTQVLFEYGPPEAAEAAFCELTELAPQDASAFHNLGTIRQRLKQPENAARAFRESLKLRPNYPLTHLQLGYALKESGAREDAARAWKTVLQLDPTNTEARIALTSI
jgi:tetratricopeptide (TPR) repeat protein